MTRGIDWLSARPRLNLLIVAVYYLLTVAFHDRVQGLALFAIKRLSVERVNVIGAVVATIVLLAMMPWYANCIRRGPRIGVKVFAALAMLVCVLLAYRWLFAVNSEAIHFLQYSILACLVFPLVGRMGETVIWSTLLGGLDESVQYWVLHGGWDVYLDFNDFILNLLGSGIGVLILAATLGFGPEPPARSSYTFRQFLRSPAFFALTVVIIAIGALFAAGQMTLYKNPDSSPWLVLRRIGPPVVFWSRPEWGHAYHVLMPGEAAALMAGLAFAAVGLDFHLERPTLK